MALRTDSMRPAYGGSGAGTYSGAGAIGAGSIAIGGGTGTIRYSV